MSLPFLKKYTKADEPMGYLDDVFRYAKARLGNHDDAEDIAIEVVQALPAKCCKDNLRLYMIGMARRKVADRLRKRTDDTLASQASERAFDRDSDEAATIDCVLSSLADNQREALILKYVIGLTSQEVGVAMGRSGDAADSLLQRARTAFSKEWNRLHESEMIL